MLQTIDGGEEENGMKKYKDWSASDELRLAAMCVWLDVPCLRVCMCHGAGMTQCVPALNDGVAIADVVLIHQCNHTHVAR